MRIKLIWKLGLIVLGFLPLIVLFQGCTTQVPSLTEMKTKPPCAPFLFHGFESNSEFSNITGSTDTKTLSPLHVAQGQWSLDLDITNPLPASSGPGPNNWNDQFYIEAFSSPQNWNNYSQLIADIYIDPTVLAGASYSQLMLLADSPVTFYQPICSSQPAITSGQQSVTWGINLGAGGILKAANGVVSSTYLTKLYLIINANTTKGTGNVYLDNLRLVYTACP